MSKFLRALALLVVLGVIGLGATAAAVWVYVVPELPSIESLKDVRLQVPLRIHTADGLLLAEFGEKRRTPVHLKDVPESMIKAVLAAEDDRFYQHPGVDWEGLVRAVWYLIKTGEKGPGGSTITMQVARNFFLGREKTYIRKLKEILLALKIERELGKDEILELYFNKIFLGHRAYGVGAAAQVYYGRPISELGLAQFAMIAGLPKAPSRFNPIVNPTRALARRNYVLGRMRSLGYIDEATYEQASSARVSARLHALKVEIEAPYVAEMVRTYVEERFGADAYTAGYRVVTTINSRLQAAANQAVRESLSEYDERHGYRGPELRADLDGGVPAWEAILADVPVTGGLIPALVIASEGQTASLYAKGEGELELDWPAMSWARAYVNENRRGPVPKEAAEILSPGDVVRVRRVKEAWRLAQVPQVEGALVSIKPGDGAIQALVGGFDFFHSKFNRVTQAKRQPGSNFKPFIYSAALENGYTAASRINDAPVVFDDPGLEAVWRPENYSGKFFGPTRLREALTKSRNLVSIRLLRAVGVDTALTHVERFGFEPGQFPRNLSIALGSGVLTPLQIARGYSVLANGGFLIEPFFVARIDDSFGDPLFEHVPPTACPSCGRVDPDAVFGPPQAHEVAAFIEPANGVATKLEPVPERPAKRTVDERNVWLMYSILQDVIRRGTGRKARALKRTDLAGKTGTTNEQRDAWFSGFSPALETTTWVGFDRVRPLGKRETGGRAALPMWIKFMREALDGVPDQPMEQPDGIVSTRIDPATGLAVRTGQENAIFEVFRAEMAPKPVVEEAGQAGPKPADTGTAGGVTKQLF